MANETSPYNEGSMRVLMACALDVDFDATIGAGDDVSCPALGVTVVCSEEGAATLVALANAGMSAVDAAYNTALETRDRRFNGVQCARQLADQMLRLATANALAAQPAAEG